METTQKQRGNSNNVETKVLQEITLLFVLPKPFPSVALPFTYLHAAPTLSPIDIITSGSIIS